MSILIQWGKGASGFQLLCQNDPSSPSSALSGSLPPELLSEEMVHPVRSIEIGEIAVVMAAAGVARKVRMLRASVRIEAVFNNIIQSGTLYY
jgi:hypothetical protein